MTKKQLPALSPTETEILRLIWQLGKASVQEVCENLPPSHKISYATVQTLLRRLEKKGYTEHELRGNAHVFFAAVQPEAVIKRSVGDFLERLFGGNPIPLMQYLAKHGKVKVSDIEKLKELVEDE
jgi:BlaI family transcriptional regulator, penicillinase repressor